MLRYLAKNGSVLGRQDVYLPVYTLAHKYSTATAETASLNANLKSFDEIPGPKEWPIVGHLLATKQFGMLHSFSKLLINYNLIKTSIRILQEENMIRWIWPSFPMTYIVIMEIWFDSTDLEQNQ